MEPGQDLGYLALAMTLVGFIESMVLIVIFASLRFMAKRR